MESALNSQRESAIRDEAADWLLARQEGLDSARSRQFERWLATSPAHLAEYHAMERLGRDLPLAAKSAATVDELVERARVEEPPHDNIVPLVAANHGVRAIRHRNPPLALAAVFAFLAIGTTMFWPQVADFFSPQVRETRFASGRTPQWVPLEDGSKLRLYPDSTVVVRYSAQQRQVQLQSGGARFEVEHDAARPFAVMAGAARIVDVGTIFDVYLQADVTRVTVLQGRVEVSSEGVSGARQLGEGQQIRVEAGQGLADPSVGEIFFDGVPLGEATADINHFLLKPIVIESQALRGEAIHYTFHTDDVNGFLDFLRDSLRARVEERTDQIVVNR